MRGMRGLSLDQHSKASWGSSVADRVVEGRLVGADTVYKTVDGIHTMLPIVGTDVVFGTTNQWWS